MSESLNSTNDLDYLDRQVHIVKKVSNNIASVLNSSFFLGIPRSSKINSLKTNIKIITQESSAITTSIEKSRLVFNSSANKILLNELRDIYDILHTLFEFIKDNTPKSALASGNPENKEIDLIFLEEIIKLSKNSLFKTRTLINTYISLLDISDSHKSEFIEGLTIDLAEIYKNFFSKNKEELDNLKKDIKNLNERVEEIDKQLINNINAVKISHNDVLKLNTNIQNLENSLLDEFKKVREETEIFYKSEISSLVKEASDTKSEVTERIRAELYGYMVEQDKEKLRLAQAIDNTKKNHEDFISLVERAGIYELTQNYSKKADEEKQEYKDYRKYTTWAILAAIAATLIIFALPLIESWIIKQVVHMDYFTLFARLTISIMFFALAFYTSQQAGKHYECYQENHRTYLQLAALEPFISRMSDEDKLAIRKELISVYFNKADDGKFAAKGDEVDLPSNINSIVHKLIDTVKDNKQAVKNDD